MIFIIMALPVEAKPLIHYYNLKRVDDEELLLFANEEMRLCITQVGYENALCATQKLLEQYKPKKMICS